MTKLFKALLFLSLASLGYGASAPTAALLGINPNSQGYTGVSTFTLVDQANVQASLILNNLTIDGSVSGNPTFNGNVIFSGSVTSGAQNGTSETLSGLQIFSPQVILNVTTQTTITPTSTYVQVESTGGPVQLGNITNGGTQFNYVAISTAGATSGQLLFLYSTGSVTSVQITTSTIGQGYQDGVTGSANNLSTAFPKMLQFEYDAPDSIWREVHD